MPANLIFLNPNSLFSASHRQMTTMKAFVLGSAATFGLALSIYAQTPAATPETSAPSPTLAATAAPAVSVSPAISATPSAANQFADKIKERDDRKFKHKGYGITVAVRDSDQHDVDLQHGHDEIPEKLLSIS